MSPGIKLDSVPADERIPELEEILEGRDGIVLDPELLADAKGVPPSPVDELPTASVEEIDEASESSLDDDLRPGGYKPEHEAISIRVKRMPVSHRIKLALTGGHEARVVLGRDPVRLVQRCVLMNPRITLEEVLAIAKNRSVHGSLLRQVAEQRDWVRQYSIRVALVTNPKTPLQISLKLMTGLNEREVRVLAKSRNVSSVIQAQARRTLLRKEG